MKKIGVFILLVFFPTILFSQWSFAGSAAVGVSEVKNNYMKKYYKDSKGQLGLDFAVTARYTIWKLYLSSGVGFQTFKSQSGRSMESSLIDYKSLNPQFSYSNVYVPLTIGFNYNRWKIYPIAEAGVKFLFTTELKDRLDINSETTSRIGGSKSTVVAFVGQAGVGYAFNYRYSLEAKFRFSSTGDVSIYKYPDGTNYKSTWQFIGAQVSFVVRIPKTY